MLSTDLFPSFKTLSADFDASSLAESSVACVVDTESSEALDTNSVDFFLASETIFDASSLAADSLRAASLSVCLIFLRTSAIVKFITYKMAT